MIRDDTIRIAREVWGDDSGKPWSESALLHLERFAALLEAKVRADEREKLLATFLKIRDESHTIQGASDDYKEGRLMGVQVCINELSRGER
jgi:hypothetical protein